MKYANLVKETYLLTINVGNICAAYYFCRIIYFLIYILKGRIYLKLTYFTLHILIQIIVNIYSSPLISLVEFK